MIRVAFAFRRAVHSTRESWTNTLWDSEFECIWELERKQLFRFTLWNRHPLIFSLCVRTVLVHEDLLQTTIILYHHHHHHHNKRNGMNELFGAALGSDNVPLWWKKAALFIFGVTSVNRVLWHCDTICTHITCMYSMARMRIRMRHIVCIFILSASKEKRFWSGGSDTNTKRWWPIFFSTFVLYKSIISTSTM